MKKAWVTGAFGFVGPYLSTELVRRGLEVQGIDRPDRPPTDGGIAEPLAVDLTDPSLVSQALQRHRPDAIFHLAAQSSAALSFSEPGETLHQNVQSTVGLLEGIRSLGNDAPFLLSVGSCEEYGPVRDDELPVREEQPLRPASPYAVSKSAQTLLALQYHQAYGLPIVCTRSFTHTGPGQSTRFVFPSFAKQIAQQEQALDAGQAGVLRVGNLEAVRDVSDVRDVARAYCDLLERGEPGRVFNVCSGRGLRIVDGLEILRSLSTLRIEVLVDPDRLRPLDVPRFVGDPSRLEECLGWKPDTAPEKTLGDLLEHWREQVALGSGGAS